MNDSAAPAYNRNNPFSAKIIERRPLTGTAGDKVTFHVAIDLANSGLSYKCGDCIGIYPSNSAKTVDTVLAALGLNGETNVQFPEGQTSLRQALKSRFSLAGVTRNFLQAVYERESSPTQKAALETVLQLEAPEQKAWLGARELVDVAEEFPNARFSPQELCGYLQKLAPRLYSIASSPLVFPQAVHLVVAIVRYETNGRKREGICSNFLAHHAPLAEAQVPIFINPTHFAPPADASAPVIMVGPGAGLAPFRGFLQERVARGSSGKNWLFFGDRHEAHDFLHREELQQWQAEGVLTELSTAWSRDQAEKFYVQDVMLQRGDELWRWLQAGAFFYVCGDAKHMARDVDLALQEIIVKHGNKTSDEARDYLAQLRKEKRYQRDVY